MTCIHFVRADFRAYLLCFASRRYRPENVECTYNKKKFQASTSAEMDI